MIFSPGLLLWPVALTKSRCPHGILGELSSSSRELLRWGLKGVDISLQLLKTRAGRFRAHLKFSWWSNNSFLETSKLKICISQKMLYISLLLPVFKARMGKVASKTRKLRMSDFWIRISFWLKTDGFLFYLFFSCIVWHVGHVGS